MRVEQTIDQYIDSAPTETRAKLRHLRAAIREAAPDAVESISYGMPYYSFRGETGFQSRLCYFGLLKSKKKIVFYTRPRFLEPFRDEVASYVTAKSALHFRLDQPLPISLVKKLVKNGVQTRAAPSG